MSIIVSSMGRFHVTPDTFTNWFDKSTYCILVNALHSTIVEKIREFTDATFVMAKNPTDVDLIILINGEHPVVL